LSLNCFEEMGDFGEKGNEDRRWSVGLLCGLVEYVL